jgi:hypothetical protein
MKISVIKRKLHSLIMFGIPLCFLSVKCERPETVGPEYALAPKDFAVLSYSMGNPSVNLATAKDTFYASFSHKVSWTITLTGANSGAVKKISGTSQVIDGSNSSWLWDGSHDGLYFFRAGEKVGAKLSFLGSNITLTDSVLVNTTKIFKDIVVIDFETTPGWIAYGDAGDNPNGFQVITEGAPLNSYIPNRYFTKSLQGTRGYYWYGADLNGSYFCGGGKRALTPAERAKLPSTGDSLYLNVYIYGLGNGASKLNFGASEDDNDGPAFFHEPASDDEFQVQITLDHVGWKLFSFKYTDLIPGANPNYGGNGNKIHEPKRIVEITFGLISAPKGSYVEAIVDFPVLTFGAPFNPAK